MAVRELRIIIPLPEATCYEPAMQPNENGCRAASHASSRKHNAIPIGSWRGRSRSQKEADQQARQLRAAESRLKRSVTTGSLPTSKAFGRPIGRGHRHTNSLSPAKVRVFRGAVEPPHEQLLARMAFAEQQQWITVQQKTFTKW